MDGEGTPGGGDGAGLAEKALRPINIAPQNDTAEAQEAARLQGDVYNITFWMIVVHPSSCVNWQTASTA